MTNRISFVDLFAGIGGMRLGLERADGECLFSCEWDSKAQETYQANFGEGSIAGDIRQICSSEIPDHDLLVAGFPCQPFSIAGVSKKNSLGREHGFADEAQGSLFFEIARLIDEKRPAAFLLENVKNLRSHDKGRTFEVIRRVLEEELGYNLQVRVINAKGWVPQNRERIFLAGFLSPTDFDFSALEVPDPGSGPSMEAVLHPGDGSEAPEPPFTEGPKAKVSARYTITPRLWDYLQSYAEKHRAAGNGFGYGLVGPRDTARTLSARYYKDGSEILVKQRGPRPRRLTPRECARLMGFDRPGRSDWIIPVSDHQAYRQFGNAVVPHVVEAIAIHMKPSILQIKRAASTNVPKDVPQRLSCSA